MANGPSCPARSSSVSTDTPCQAVSSFDHFVTQWMSTVTSWLGRSRNSAQLHVFCCPLRPTEKLQRSRAVCGVGPADRTGKSSVTYWPGGTLPAFAAGSWRLRWNPRETGLMTATFPSPKPANTPYTGSAVWPRSHHHEGPGATADVYALWLSTASSVARTASPSTTMSRPRSHQLQPVVSTTLVPPSREVAVPRLPPFGFPWRDHGHCHPFGSNPKHQPERMRGYCGWRDGNLATPRRVSSGVRR